jgi:hypothetical protein
LGQSLFITSNIDPDHHLAMQSDFKHMLKEIQNLFEDPTCDITPCEALEALDETLASLHQIKKSLEKNKEYYAAQVEKDMIPKYNQVLLLKNHVKESKAAAEKLLGFSLKPEHFTKGEAYMLMPLGFVNKVSFELEIQNFQKPIKDIEKSLDLNKGMLEDLKSPDDKPLGYITRYDKIDEIEKSIQVEEYHLNRARSELLGYFMTHQPMLDTTFSNKLAVHLNSMLDAYLELKKLEQSKP